MRATTRHRAALLALGGALTLLGPPALAGSRVGPPSFSVPHTGRPHLDSGLVGVTQALRREGTSGALAAAAGQHLDVVGGKVAVIVQARAGDETAAAAAAAAAGGEVSGRAGPLLEVLVPPAALQTLAASAAVAVVRPPAVAAPAATAGEALIRNGGGALQAAGYDGSGVKVAIVDFGFSGYTTLLGSGLPASVTTIDHCGGNLDAAPPQGTAHGTAVAEQVHQMAPGAQLMLICIDSEVGLAQAEQDAISAGAKVVNHSVVWFGTSRGDGSGAAGMPDAIVADARRHGILWVNAAGNETRDHWAGTFTPSASDPDVNTFLGADMQTDRVTIGAGEQACVSLTWDDWPTTTEDFDLGLFRLSDGALVASSANDQAHGPLPPAELLCYTNTEASQDFGIAVVRYSAVGTPRLELFYIGAGTLGAADPAGSVGQPASAPAALAVGAVCWTGGDVEAYSSRGPTIDGRQKPDLVAPDSVSSSVYGAFAPAPGCGASGFAGTSAAAPQVAGAAALLLQRTPSLTPAGLEGVLTGRALVHAGYTTPQVDAGSGPLWLDGSAPSGTIAFSQVFGGGLFTIRPDGTDRTRVFSGAQQSYLSPALSPDGSVIAFSDGGVLKAVGIDGTGLRTIASPPTGEYEQPAWRPDGAKLALNDNGKIAVVNADGSGLTDLTSGTGATAPAWSPNGQKLAYVSGSAGSFDVWTMNADGSQQTRLTSLGTVDHELSQWRNPAWSPDGTRIAFATADPSSPTHRLWVVNADGSGAQALTSATPQAPLPSQAVSPVWAPDGSQILFEDAWGYGCSSCGGLYAVRPNGTGEHRVATAPGDGPPNAPTWVAPFTAVAPAAVVAPALRGSARAGQALAASVGSWSGTTPLSFSYAWSRCNASGASCGPIPGASDSFYAAATADVGSTLVVTVTVANAQGSASASSPPSGVVVAAAPYATAPPTVSGSAQIGATLTATSAGTWSGSPTSFAYQWRRCDALGGGCANVPGATATTYAVTSADGGATLRVAVTATAAGGTATATSAQTAAVLAAPANVSPPTISGTAQSGATLTASLGTWIAEPAPTFAYQWQRCNASGLSCASIAGATASSYVVSSGDVGSTLRVRVTATNTLGSATATSAASAVVAAIPSGGGSSGGGSSSGGGGAVPPDLHVDLTASAATPPVVGAELIYFATVSSKNVGASSAVRLDLTLPDGYTVTTTYSDRGPGCTGAAPKLTCDVAWISPGTPTHVTVWGTVGAAGELVATATVTSLVEPEANAADNTATLKLEPAAAPTPPPSVEPRTLPPRVVAAPVVKGTPRVGSTLRATAPRWSQKPDTVTYRWQLCAKSRCTPITGAAGLTLKLKAAYAGKSVRLVATATFDGKKATSATKRIAVRKKP